MYPDDLTGQRFGRLVAMHKVPQPPEYKRRGVWWHCRCDCGKEVDKPRNALLTGNAKSCGCLGRGRWAGGNRKQATLYSDSEYVKIKSRGLTYVATCPECKKPFERPCREWGYTFDGKKYCTYKCMRAAEARKIGKKKEVT